MELIQFQRISGPGRSSTLNASVHLSWILCVGLFHPVNSCFQKTSDATIHLSESTCFLQPLSDKNKRQKGKHAVWQEILHDISGQCHQQGRTSVTWTLSYMLNCWISGNCNMTRIETWALQNMGYFLKFQSH